MRLAGRLHKSMPGGERYKYASSVPHCFRPLGNIFMKYKKSQSHYQKCLKHPVSGQISIAHVTTKGHVDIPGLGCPLAPSLIGCELALPLPSIAWESSPQGPELAGCSTWDSGHCNLPGQHSSADPGGTSMYEPALRAWEQENWPHPLPGECRGAGPSSVSCEQGRTNPTHCQLPQAGEGDNWSIQGPLRPRSRTCSWPKPTSSPSKNWWILRRGQSCKCKATGSPWHRVTAGYSRRILVRLY